MEQWFVWIERLVQFQTKKKQLVQLGSENQLFQPSPSLHNPTAASFIESRQILRRDTADAIKLAQTKMALRYDAKHRIPDLVGSVSLKLAKTGDAGYHIPKTSSLSTKRVGPYRILEKVSPLAYRLELPPGMSKTYPVISVIHLEQAKPDPFQREVPPPAPVIFQGHEEYVIDKIVRREKRGKESGYQVRWKGSHGGGDPEENTVQSMVENMLQALPGNDLTEKRYNSMMAEHTKLLASTAESIRRELVPVAILTSNYCDEARRFHNKFAGASPLVQKVEIHAC